MSVEIEPQRLILPSIYLGTMIRTEPLTPEQQAKAEQEKQTQQRLIKEIYKLLNDEGDNKMEEDQLVNEGDLEVQHLDNNDLPVEIANANPVDKNMEEIEKFDSLNDNDLPKEMVNAKPIDKNMEEIKTSHSPETDHEDSDNEYIVPPYGLGGKHKKNTVRKRKLFSKRKHNLNQKSKNGRIKKNTIRR